MCHWERGPGLNLCSCGAGPAAPAPPGWQPGSRWPSPGSWPQIRQEQGHGAVPSLGKGQAGGLQPPERGVSSSGAAVLLGACWYWGYSARFVLLQRFCASEVRRGCAELAAPWLALSHRYQKVHFRETFTLISTCRAFSALTLALMRTRSSLPWREPS